MAALHAEFWACGPEFDVVPAMHRYLELSVWTAMAETAAGSAHLVPQLVGKGWPLLAEVAPAAAAVVTPLARDPGPLVEALATTPHTFVHSNFKLDNLGTDDLGRTVVLDWEQPGHGAPLSDLAWYLAINCRPAAAIQGGLDRGLPAGARGVRHRHRTLVGPAAGPVLARCPGPVRLGEGLRRLRRGTRMVGDARRAGGRAAELTAGLRAGYDAAAPAWADGPGPMYARLAGALVAAAPVPVAGRRVLDLGAGAGVAGQAALAAGARQVVGADLSVAMLRRGRAAQDPAGARPASARPVAADAAALPFQDHSFDLVLAAFCFNHLAHLAPGLAEARRVGGALAASMFAPGWTHPAKDAVDGALRSFGYQPPRLVRRAQPRVTGRRPGRARRGRGRRGLRSGAGAHDRGAHRVDHPRRPGVMAARHGSRGPVRPRAGRSERRHAPADGRARRSGHRPLGRDHDGAHGPLAGPPASRAGR